MSCQLEDFFAKDVADFIQTLQSLSQRIDPQATPQFDDYYEEFLKSVDRCLASCKQMDALLAEDARQLAAARHRFQEAIRPWFDQSAFMRHALAKPRGYAGDYEMLIAIYEGQPRSRGLGGYLDLYFLNTELGRAVPARLRGVKHFLMTEAARRGGAISVLDIACGPAREFYEGFELPADCRMTVTCLDHDDAALDYVRTQVAPRAPYNLALEFVKHNALKMMSGSVNRRVFGEPDIIYSVGLCDYIPDQIMIRLLRGWHETVAAGGVIYVAFKDCLRYNSAPYQWLVDWHFFQRTESDCLRLFAQAGYHVEDMEMVRDDDLGTIMNFISRAPAAPQHRLDRAAEVAAPRSQSASDPVEFAAS
jgi:SAM-dependent methyltransferase